MASPKVPRNIWDDVAAQDAVIINGSKTGGQTRAPVWLSSSGSQSI